MSDRNMSRKAAVRQENASHGKLALAYFKDGLSKSGQAILSPGNLPESKGAAAFYAARVTLAGGKSYANAAKHAGLAALDAGARGTKAFMGAAMRQNPHDGRGLNNMRISQALAQGRPRSVNTNKGIASMKSKAAKAKANAAKSGPSVNQGIKNFRSKSSGQATGGQRRSQGGAPKASKASGGQSKGGGGQRR